MARPHRIFVFGAHHSGKSNLISQLLTRTFDSSYHTSFFVHPQRWTVAVDDSTIEYDIWDTAGQEKYQSIPYSALNRSSGVLLVFDLTDSGRFEVAEVYAKALKSASDSVILIGNKSDDTEHRTVTRMKAERLAESYDFPYLETSAKTGEGVREAFVSLVRRILEKGANSAEKSVERTSESDRRDSLFIGI